MVIGKLTGGCANADMGITPPVVGEGNVIGETDVEITAIVLIDGYTHLLGGMIITNLHNCVVIDLEIKREEEEECIAKRDEEKYKMNIQRSPGASPGNGTWNSNPCDLYPE